jgi:O-antigen ligase
MNNILNVIKDKKTILNYLIVCYAFVLPLGKAPSVLFGLLLIIFWLLDGEYKEKLRVINESNFIKYLAALILLSTIAVLWSPDFEFWLEFMRKYWHFLVIPVIYTSIRHENIKTVFSAFLLGMLLSEIVAFGVFFKIWEYGRATPDNPTPFMDHVNYSIFLALTALILLNRVFFEEKMHLKMMYFAYFLLVTTNLFIIAGRTGQVAFATGLLVIGLLNIKNKFKAITLMSVLGAIILTGAYSFSSTFEVRADQAINEVQGMINTQDFSGSLGQRISLWVMGSHVFLDNPFFGTGIGSEANGMNEYAEKYNFTENVYVKDGGYVDYHNTFVQYAVQLGAPGLILFCLILVSLIRLKFSSRIYFNINVAFVLVYALLSMGGFSFHLMNSMTLFVLLSSTLAAISRYESLKSEDHELILPTQYNAKLNEI